MAAADLVRLGRHHPVADAVLGEPVGELAVLARRRVAQVNHLHDPDQRAAGGEVGAHHRPPGAPHLDRHLGEAVAGEIDEVVAVVDPVEVEALGAPRGVGGAGEAAAIEEGVDQRALADVGATGEGDLGEAVGGILRGPPGVRREDHAVAHPAPARLHATATLSMRRTPSQSTAASRTRGPSAVATVSRVSGWAAAK